MEQKMIAAHRQQHVLTWAGTVRRQVAHFFPPLFYLV